MTTSQRLTLSDVSRLLSVSEEFLRTLDQEALVHPDPQGYYEQASLSRIRVCWSLQEELGVNPAGIEVALHLLERIEAERRQFRDVLGWLNHQLGR